MLILDTTLMVESSLYDGVVQVLKGLLNWASEVEVLLVLKPLAFDGLEVFLEFSRFECFDSFEGFCDEGLET